MSFWRTFLGNVASAAAEREFMRSVEIGAAALARRALLLGCADEGLSITLRGCHVRGEPWGDWEFTARRLVPARGIEAGADETPQAAQPVGREPGPKDAA